MSVTIEVKTRVVGNASESLKIGPILVHLTRAQVIVSQLLERAVMQQIEKLGTKAEMSSLDVRELLARQSFFVETDLFPSQNVLEFDSDWSVGDSSFEIGAQIRKAQEAFEQGKFILLIDERRVDSLEAELTLTSDTKVEFLRLIPLTGG